MTVTVAYSYRLVLSDGASSCFGHPFTLLYCACPILSPRSFEMRDGNSSVRLVWNLSCRVPRLGLGGVVTPPRDPLPADGLLPSQITASNRTAVAQRCRQAKLHPSKLLQAHSQLRSSSFSCLPPSDPLSAIQSRALTPTRSAYRTHLPINTP